MSDQTKISWCDSTFNPWVGCTKVSAGCAHCYAERANVRFRGDTPGNWGPGAPRRVTVTSNWRKPVMWNRMAASCGSSSGAENCPFCSGPAGPHRHRVFCGSQCDWLDEEAPIEAFARLLALIHATPNLDWLMLSKRPQNWEDRLAAAWMQASATEPKGTYDLQNWINDWYGRRIAPANVWIGTTVEDQTRADERIPHLLSIPARVRFLSCEPLLEQIDISYPESFYPNGPTRCCDGRECACMGMPIDPPLVWELQWVICGGESGPFARPMHPDWARGLRDQCAAAGVAFHFKQWGEWIPEKQIVAALPWTRMYSHPDGTRMLRAGKEIAGRKLDGVEHDAFPVVGKGGA